MQSKGGPAPIVDEERKMQILFGLLVIGIPAALEVLVWRGVKAERKGKDRKSETLLLFSAVIFSLNIMILYFLYVADLLVLGKHSVARASQAEYRCLILELWGSRIALVLSLATIFIALFSTHSLARKLCIWGSVAGMIYWFVLHVAASDMVRIYLLNQRM